MTDHYPHTPGFKARDTSKAAADALAPIVRTLQARVLEAIRQRPGSADDIAIRLGLHFLSVRPRCSELDRLGLIEDSGLRDRTAFGKRATVWKAV